MRIAFALALGLLLSLSVQAAASYKVYLTNQAKDGVPLNRPGDNFGCSDTIYAVIELKDVSPEKHELEAFWRDPAGKDRERTRYPFWVRRDRERIWVWLKLHSPPESALVQWANPSAGMEEFIGEWEIRLFIDGQQIERKKFEVIC